MSKLCALFCCTVAATGALVLPGAASSATLQLKPFQDTTIYADNTGFASGTGQSGFFGMIARSSARRALVQFDLSGIPVGSLVTDATLSILVDRAQGPASPAGVHRALAAWGEATSDGGASGVGAIAAAGEATWLARINGSAAWSRPGGDFIDLSSATTVVNGAGTVSWRATPTLLADLQSWVDTPAANYGWFLIGDESGQTRTAARFVASEGDGSTVPTLTVQFTPRAALEPLPPTLPPIATVPEPATAWALLLALGALGFVGRRTIDRIAFVRLATREGPA